MVEAFRQSLTTAKRARLTNSSTDLARIVEVPRNALPRNALPPVAVVQTGSVEEKHRHAVSGEVP